MEAEIICKWFGLGTILLYSLYSLYSILILILILLKQLIRYKEYNIHIRRTPIHIQIPDFSMTSTSWSTNHGSQELLRVSTFFPSLRFFLSFSLDRSARFPPGYQTGSTGSTGLDWLLIVIPVEKWEKWITWIRWIYILTSRYIPCPFSHFIKLLFLHFCTLQSCLLWSIDILRPVSLSLPSLAA